MEILLALYLAELEGQPLTGERLAALIRLGPAATVRWLALLQARGFIEPERGARVAPGASVRISPASKRRIDQVIASADP